VDIGQAGAARRFRARLCPKIETVRRSRSVPRLSPLPRARPCRQALACRRTLDAASRHALRAGSCAGFIVMSAR